MKDALQKVATVAAEKSVEIASGGTVITGTATVFSILAPVAGTIASILGSVIAYTLWVKKNRLLDLQIQALEGKEAGDA